MNDRVWMSNRRLLLSSLFIISLTLMLYEINLVRLFSILIRNVSFFVLAIALFGFGLGGLYAQIWRGRMRPAAAEFDHAPFVLPILASVSMVFALLVMAVIPIPMPGSPSAISTPLAIAILFLATALPFFFGSMLMAQIFAKRPDEAGRLYFADLAGASLACLLAVPVLQYIGGFTAPFFAAALALVTAFPATKGSMPRRAILAGVMALVIGLGIGNARTGFIELSPDPSIKEREILFDAWSFSSWITVEENDIGWRGWRLSDSYAGPPPEYRIIRQDGHAPAFIRKFAGDFGEVRDLEYDITSLPYRIFDPKEVLVIGAGGGRDILTAKLYGVPHVTGVELHPITANRVMRGALREYSGNVYGMEGVDVVVDNGRTFVERTDRKFDFIYTSLADTLLGNSQGVYVLSENHLYTVEAFSAYLSRLKPGGFACILYTALEEGHLLPRFTGNVIEALREHGVTRPQDHLLAIITPDPPGGVDEGVCVMFGLDPISPAAVERAHAACEDLGFTLAWPAIGSNPLNAEISSLFDAEERRSYLASSYFDLSPLRDDRPFLFYNNKPSDFLELMLHPGKTADRISFGARNFPILVDMFFVVLLLVLALMISPLVIFKRNELGGGRPLPLALLGLFLLLGIGFMFIEVALLQRLFIYLGSPTLTFAVVLGVMLLFAGIGSFISSRFDERKLWQSLLGIAVAVIVMQLLVAFTLDSITGATLGLSLGFRLLTCCPLLAAISVPMGMLFPTCMRVVAYQRLDIVCWAWGMNGVGSVLGSVGASLLALNIGIQNVYFAGVITYGLVLVVVLAAYLLAPGRTDSMPALNTESAMR